VTNLDDPETVFGVLLQYYIERKSQMPLILNAQSSVS